MSLTLVRKAAGRDFVNRLWASARAGEGVSGRACPTCNRQMLEVTIPTDDTALALDVCKICQFVWFDPQEFEAAPKPEPTQCTPEKPALPQAAREAIALAEVQRMGERARANDTEPDETWKTIPALFGMPVESDTDALQHIPWLTWATAATVTLISVLTFSNLNEIADRFGFVPTEAWRYGGLTSLTSFFLHGGIFHLVSNMYFLLIFGDNVEDFLGRGRWLALVLLATLTGDLLHYVGEPHSTIPAIGASGGISGLIAFYALKFPRARLGFLWRFYWHFRWIQMPAWVAFGLWIALQGFGAFDQIAGLTNVSSLAHLGGAGIGFLFWLVWRNK